MRHLDLKYLLQQPLPEWEDRVETYCCTKNFHVTITPRPKLLRNLTADQKRRLRWKLDLVVRAAQFMAAGMLKGTLKYPTDEYTLETGFAHLLDEGADQLNYQLLLADAFQKAQAKAGSAYM